jgi:2,5-dihydroxypyridine 5,6-dioxygenase
VPFRQTFGGATELVELFKKVLTHCRLVPHETMLVYTDNHSHPHYAAAFLAAGQALGATVLQVNVPANTPPVETGVIARCWNESDLVVDLASITTSIYRPLRTNALAAGTRILRVTDPEDVLFRMPPDPKVRDRAKAAEALLDGARRLHVTSAAGTDLEVAVSGRKAFGLWGVADRPGTWDHWPMGLVVIGGNRQGTNGRLVVDVGDLLLALPRYVDSPIRMSVEEGVITAIEGGADARILRTYFERWNDPRAYWISHIGWGLDHRTVWTRMQRKDEGGTADAESFYGVMQIAFGRDTSFLGGTNDVPAHMDFDCLHNSVAVDGLEVLRDGAFTYEPFL